MLTRFLIAVLVLLALSALAAVFLLVQPLVKPLATKVPQVDTRQLVAHVRYLSIDAYPRSHDHPANLQRAARYIARRFTEAGATISEQQVTVEGGTYSNIIARFGPKQGPLLVIGAHYDSYGDAYAARRDGQRFSVNSHTPGADDNASGVAGLLELARLLGQRPPPHPVELVAYTLEEPPHFATSAMGSAWHARALAREKREVRLMLSLEMIGYFSDAPGSQSYPLPALRYLYPERGNFIALVGRVGDFGAMRRAKALMAGASDMPAYSINAPRSLTGIDFSDHRSYWQHGYPALMVTDTAFFRNPHYHRGSDTYETLDYKRMAQVVQGVYAIAHHY